MKKIEQIELSEYRSQIIDDVKGLVEKYRTIFDWDVPEIDQNVADNLILGEIRKTLQQLRADGQAKKLISQHERQLPIS